MLDTPDRSPTPQPRPNAKEPGETPHILVVNSSPDFLKLMGELFSDEQYRVTTEIASRETPDQISRLRPDLTIVDLAVREPSAWELLAGLRAEPATRTIPVIVTSTSNTLLERAEAEHDRLAGDCYLLKPMDLDNLLATVRELIVQNGAPPRG